MDDGVTIRAALPGEGQTIAETKRASWQADGATLVDDRGEVTLHEVRYRRDLDELT